MESSEILKLAKSLGPTITQWRRDLHQRPEVGVHTPMTTNYICEKLTEFGISYTTYEKHSGITALLGNHEGKCLALRADIDGLPIQEKTECSFSSCNGNMHACGHDSHTAMLLGAAKILKNIEPEIPGCIKLIFEAGEESGGGGKVMVEDGVLKNPDVQAMISLHVESPGGEFNNGDIVIWKGATHASNDEFYITLTGKGGHGGRPYLTIDPVAAAALLINNLQYISSRETNPNMPVAISIGEVTTGKSAVNIIPDKISINGTVRNSDPLVREHVLQRFEEIVRGVCMAMRVTYELNFMHGEPVVVNDDNVRKVLFTSAENLFGSSRVHTVQGHNMGSEDIGYFFEKVPGAMFRFCIMKPDKDGVIYQLHNAKMNVDDTLLYRGTALLIDSALQFLNRN